MYFEKLFPEVFMSYLMRGLVGQCQVGDGPREILFAVSVRSMQVVCEAVMYQQKL